MSTAGRDAHVHAQTATANGVALSPNVEIRHHMYGTWSVIAVTHEAEARAARRQAEQVHAAGQNWAEDADEELQCAVVCVCAAAFALDGLAGALVRKIGPTQVTSGRTQARMVCDVVARSLDTGILPGGAMTRITQLLDLRGGAVHDAEGAQRRGRIAPRSEQTAPLKPHPLGGHGSWAVGTFTAEAATEAVDTMLEVFELVAAHGIARVSAEAEAAQRFHAQVCAQRGVRCPA